MKARVLAARVWAKLANGKTLIYTNDGGVPECKLMCKCSTTCATKFRCWGFEKEDLQDLENGQAEILDRIMLHRLLKDVGSRHWSVFS